MKVIKQEKSHIRRLKFLKMAKTIFVVIVALLLFKLYQIASNMEYISCMKGVCP